MNLKKFAVLAGMAAGISGAQAGGYMVQETNGLFAQAYAGRAAAVEDGSTMFVNPAVMAYQCKHQLILNNSFIIPYAKFSKTLATQTTAAGTTAMSGNNGGNGGQFAYVPAFYAIMNAFQNVKFGIGITSPFGLSTAYDGASVLRYTATKSKLTVVNINPAVSYQRQTKCYGLISLGFGFSIQRVEADLEKMVDVNVPALLGGTRSDVLSKLRGTNNAAGINFGAIYEPCSGTRFGLAYRSSIAHRVKGMANFSNLPKFGALTGSAFAAAFANVPVYANLKTPDVVNISGVHELNNCWSVLADVMLTRWTVLRQLQVVNNITGSVLSNEVQSWRNTAMVSLGLNYRPADNWLLRTGIAFDQTPTRNKYRTARIPDQNRYWLAGGADYNWCDQVVFKLAYTHLFLPKAKINNTVPARQFAVPRLGNQTLLPGSQVVGKVKSHIDIIGLQLMVKL